MIPLFRSFISLPAGVERMNFPKFLLLTTSGSLIWNTVFVGAGYLLGENWHRVEGYAGIFQKLVLAAVADRRGAVRGLARAAALRTGPRSHTGVAPDPPLTAPAHARCGIQRMT